MYLLREINNLKLIKFLFVSALSFIINNVFNYTFIDLIEINEYLSTAITYLVLFITNFYLCKHFVFNKKNKSINLLNFILVVGSLRALEYISFLIIYTHFGLHYLIIVNSISVIFLYIKFILLNYTVLERKIIIQQNCS